MSESRSKSDIIIDEAVEGLSDYANFADAYALSGENCFRGKVNEFYNKTAPDDEQVEAQEISFWVVPRKVWSEGIDSVKPFYRDCLYKAKAKADKANTGDSKSKGTTTIDPPIGDSGPFDRRLDKLRVDDLANGAQIIIPYDTRYKAASTIGYHASDELINQAGISNQSEILKRVSDDRARDAKDPFYVGAPSLINSYSITKLYGSNGGEFLVNKKGERKWYEIDSTQNSKIAYTLNPTTTSIINWGEGDPYGRTPYHFSDFVFCKHWNVVQNNRMITLRRYAAPIVDNLKFPGMDGTTSSGSAGTKSDTGTSTDPVTDVNSFAEEPNGTSSSTEDGGTGKKVDFPPMASAITYFGEETGNQLSSILKFTTGLEWGEQTSDIHKPQTSSNPDIEAGAGGLGNGNKLFGSLMSVAKMTNVATGNYDENAIMNQGALPPDPYHDGPYENRIIGPVNAITKIRKRERGIKYENKIPLVFEYVARPIGGVNTKAAILDILSNFLVIGSASAMFWGGQHRFMSQPQKYPFLGGDKGIQKWYQGDPIGFGEESFRGFASKVTGEGGLISGAKDFFSNLMSGGGDGDILGGLKNVFQGKGIGSNILKHEAAVRSSGQIPYLTGLRALLVGEPVGEWHVTIGNPLNPIAMIGNLICESIEVEFGDELGPDDFPMEVKITVNLEHGMARDKDAIQSIFNRGMGRIYELEDGMTGSADSETKVDDYTGNTGLTGRSGSDWRSGNQIGDSTTTGGKTGPVRTSENSLQGATSVWNRASFNAVSPNQTVNLANGQNVWARSEFRSASWVSLKSLK